MPSLLRRGRPPLVIGHRGASAELPENTLPAFEAAYAAGAQWIEADVQPCADGVPVILHDEAVDRTTNGSGRVRDLTFQQVAALDAGSWRGAAASIHIPALAELAGLLDEDRFLLLEIKGDHTRDQVAADLQVLANSSFSSNVFIQSFTTEALRHVRALEPARPIGVLTHALHEDPVAVCAGLGATAYNPPFHAVLSQPAVVPRLQQAGIAVLAWTSDEPADWSALTEAGVDGIITNKPAELLAWQAGR